MKIKISPQQLRILKEDFIDKEVEDFFSTEKGKFHLLAPIPTSRMTAAEVIKRILKSENKRYDIGDNIDLNELSLINRLRFGVYLDTILNDLETRGTNFEGFMAGILDGWLPNEINYPFDFRTLQGTVEQKFIRNTSESPQIKSFAKFIAKHPEYDGLLLKDNTPENLRLKYKMLNEPGFLNDYYIFTTQSGNKNSGYRLDNYVLTKDELIQIFINPENVKAAKQGKTALRISYTKLGDVDFTITTPRYKASELNELVKLNEKEQAVLSAFGKHSDHIRPDVIKDITKILPEFIELLIQANEKY